MLTLNEWSCSTVPCGIQSIRENCRHGLVPFGGEEEDGPAEDPKESDKENPVQYRVVPPLIDKARGVDYDRVMSRFKRNGGVATVSCLVDKISAQRFKAVSVMVNDLPAKNEILNSSTVRNVSVAPRGE